MIKEPGQFNPPVENNQNTKNAEAEESNQEKPIEIDPEFLEHIRNLKPKGEHQHELINTRFAESVIGGDIERYLHDHFKKLNLETIKENILKNRKKLEKNGYNIPDNLDKKNLHKTAGNIMADFVIKYLPSNKYTDIKKYCWDLGIMPYSYVRCDDSGNLIVAEQEEEIGYKELIEIFKKYLRNNKVVDLGAGLCDFLWEASLCKAEEYIAIDNPKGDGRERSIFNEDKIKTALEVFDIKFEFCKNKHISSDILEGIYTKIPNDYSCFVIFGVDESYGLSREYIKTTNEKIAKKTKVGGIVVSRASVIGNNLPDNFEKIYESTGTVVYLRKE